jgi:hypothetical protein
VLNQLELNVHLLRLPQYSMLGGSEGPGGA